MKFTFTFFTFLVLYSSFLILTSKAHKYQWTKGMMGTFYETSGLLAE